MAEQARKEALDTLQLMLDDALIQTGKAMQDLRLEGIDTAKETLSSRMPETVRTFRDALETLESEITSAKSVMQRDLALVRSNNGQSTVASGAPPLAAQSSTETPQDATPQGVQSQSKSPMVIDLESSPVASERAVAPSTVKSEPAPSSLAPQQSIEVASGEPGSNGAPERAASSVPTAVANMAPMVPDGAPLGTKGDDTGASLETQVKTEPTTQAQPQGMPVAAGTDDNNELNFTNMTFSLAPPAEEADMSANPSEPSFDLSAFAPSEGNNNNNHENNNNTNSANANNNDNNNLMSFDDFMPQHNDQPGGGGEQNQGGQGTTDGGLDDFDFNIDSGAGDGMDFDFSLGTSGGDNNLGEFTGGDYSNGQSGDFDTDLFGLDNTNGS